MGSETKYLPGAGCTPFLGFTIALALALFGLFGLSSAANKPLLPSLLPATDSAVLPDNLITTPTRYYVGNMENGVDGWVDANAIYVDADRHMWITPDFVAVSDTEFRDGEDVHIKREGDFIILFKDSLNGMTWTPGADNSFEISKKPGLLPVKLR